MAGKIVADTLEHSTAGSIATNYLVEGSSKAWYHLDNDYSGTNPNTGQTNGVTVQDISTSPVSQIMALAILQWRGLTVLEMQFMP